MPTLRQLDTSHKILACFAILTCLSTAGALWMLTQLADLHHISVATRKNFNFFDAPVGVWLYIVFTPLAAAGLAYWLRAEVARPMREAVAAARRAAAGDLGTKVSSGGGELLTSMQEMNDKLVDVIVNVRRGAESIAGGAGEIARGSRDLGARTEEQAASLEDTATSIAQLSITVRQNSDRAHQARLLAHSASEVAHQGDEIVADVVQTLAAIDACSHRIADILGVIDDIAFQTNMLAVGAAVEAARAGEQGIGFAVVAAEVRNLAQRSGAAAREIKLLIDDSVKKAGAGAVLADKAGKTMHAIAAGAGRMTDIVGEIADASAAQSASIEQVNQAIAAIEQRNRHNGALAEQSSTAAVAVRDQAGSLSRAVGGFILDAEHGAAPLLHLVHSNPNKRVRLAPDDKRRPKVAAVRAVAPSPALQPVRGRGHAASRDLDWEEF